MEGITDSQLFLPLFILACFLVLELYRMSLAPVKDHRIEEIDLKIRAFKAKEKKLHTMDTFVALSKIQRTIALLEREKEKILDSQQPIETAITPFNLRLGLSVFFISWLWSPPMITFSYPFFGWPLSSLLSFPGHPDNVIGICAWVVICNWASSAIFQLLDPLFQR